MENPFENTEAQPKTPTFLVVICVLTFIGSGWGILADLFNIATYNTANINIQINEMTNMSSDLPQNDIFMKEFFNSSIETMKLTALHGKDIAVINLILNIMNIVGAIMMLRLRRHGFFIYTASQIMSLFVMPYFAGFSGLILAGMVGNAILAAIFIVMYAMNLKHMH